MRIPVRSLRAVAVTTAALGLLVAQPASAAEYVTDGSFESALGSSPWTSTSTNFGTSFCNAAACGTGGDKMLPRTGAVFAWFGGTQVAEVGSASQDVSVPAGRATILSFWLKVSAPRTGTTLTVSVDGAQRWGYTETTDEAAGHPYAEYTRIEVPIPGSAFDGSPTPLRFDFVSPGGETSVNYALDDVSLVDASPDPSADASVTLSPTTGSAYLGDEVTYDVELTNAGPNAADVSVRGPLPPGLQLVTTSGSALTCTPPANAGDDLTCDAGTLASGASVTGQLTLRATAIGPASLTLTSQVALPHEDLNPGNDSATATLEIEPLADLAATIHAPATATVGTPFDVTVGARNDGPSPATDATLKTELPAGFTVADRPADCAVSGTTVTCDLGTLTDGDESDRTLTVVPGHAATIELETTVAATEHDPRTTDDRATASVRVDAPPVPDPPVPPTPTPLPSVTPTEPPLAPVCLSERRFTTQLLRGRRGPGLRIAADPSRGRIVSARLTGPKGWKARKAKRTRSKVHVDLRGAPAGRYKLRVRVRIAAKSRSKARTVTITRTYRTCTPRR